MEQLHYDTEADVSVSFLKQKHVSATWFFVVHFMKKCIYLICLG